MIVSCATVPLDVSAAGFNDIPPQFLVLWVLGMIFIFVIAPAIRNSTDSDDKEQDQDQKRSEERSQSREQESARKAALVKSVQSREQESARKAAAAKSERDQAQALSEVKERSAAAVGAPSSLAFTVNNGALNLFWRSDNGHPMPRKDFVIEITKPGGPSWPRLNGAVKRSVDRSPSAIPLTEFERGATYMVRVRDNRHSKSSPWSSALTITLP
jgi:hypothetical protein